MLFFSLFSFFVAWLWRMGDMVHVAPPCITLPGKITLLDVQHHDRSQRDDIRPNDSASSLRGLHSPQPGDGANIRRQSDRRFSECDGARDSSSSGELTETGGNAGELHHPCRSQSAQLRLHKSDASLPRFRQRVCVLVPGVGASVGFASGGNQGIRWG